MSEYKVVNKDGMKEEFETEKLHCSVYYPARESEIDEEEACDIADKVVWEVKAWMSDHEDNVFTSQEIRDRVIHLLEDLNSDVCFLYKTHMDVN